MRSEPELDVIREKSLKSWTKVVVCMSRASAWCAETRHIRAHTVTAKAKSMWKLLIKVSQDGSLG
jgi:hypothetical protein